MMVMPRVATASLALAHLTQAWKPTAVISTARFAKTAQSPYLINGGDKIAFSTTQRRNHRVASTPARTVLCSRGCFCCCSRLFGSHAGSGIPGGINLEDDQTTLPNIDHDRLRATVTEIRKMIGYETYDVSLLLIEDEEMRETNMETRGVDDATDILSFPFHEAVKPGLLDEPAFDIAEYYNLGDLLVDIPYVIRSCEDDKKYEQGGFDEEESNDGEEEEEEEEEDDRGVSGAMAKVYDPEQRINMLLVHGMLHLVGYDHEDDDDYELMVTKEEEILKALKLMP